MSVKIYNGYSMDVPLVDAFLQIRKMRDSFCKSDEFLSCASNAEIKKLLPVIAELLCSKDIEKDENVWFQNAVRAVVPLESELGKSLPERLGLNDFRRTPIVWALRLSEALCAGNEKTRFTFEYDREVSLDMKIVLFPHPRDADKTLLLFYGGEASVEQNSDKTIRDDFVEMSGMKEYNFWNCTDGPDDIPENEWRERGDIWDEAIPSFVPNKDGLTYTIFSADRDRLIPMSIEYVEKRYVENREKSISRKNSMKTLTTSLDFILVLTKQYALQAKNNTSARTHTSKKRAVSQSLSPRIM